MASRGSPGLLSPSDRLATYFQEGGRIHERACYDDNQILQIASLLERVQNPWSKVPRTYIVLRVIGRLDLLNALLDLGFTDHWFPVEARSLPNTLSPSICSQIVQAQRLILTKSVDLEKGELGSHCHFGRGDPFPFTVERKLGSGGFSQVNRVVSLISYKEYALKRIRRRGVFGERTVELTKRFEDEIQIIKKLRHHHIVQYVGSYTDPNYLGLLISPVADSDLASLLENLTKSEVEEKKWDLRAYFGCLAAALHYLHSKSIRHKDIKPQNILIEKGNVLLTDFGLSLDFSDLDGSTTSGYSPKTPRYCAPEVAAHNSRNTSSDIWSLGCVYLEMLAALRGKSFHEVKEFLENYGSKEPFYHLNVEGLTALIDNIGTGEPTIDNRPLEWIRMMVKTDPKERPTSARLFEMITTPNQFGDDPSTFCGICCLDEDDVASTSSRPNSLILGDVYHDQAGREPQELTIEAYYPKDEQISNTSIQVPQASAIANAIRTVPSRKDKPSQLMSANDSTEKEIIPDTPVASPANFQADSHLWNIHSGAETVSTPESFVQQPSPGAPPPTDSCSPHVHKEAEIIAPQNINETFSSSKPTMAKAVHPILTWGPRFPTADSNPPLEPSTS